jgi:hypothetical protein
MTVLSKTLLCASIIAMTTTAFAGVATPRIEQRQDNQEQRIEQGVKSGELTTGETKRLEAQQNRIETAELRAKSDGVVTPSERARLTHRENKASRNIYRKKHNFRR